MRPFRSFAAALAASVFAAATAASLTSPALADYGYHGPAELHALSDLRLARAYLNQPAEWNVVYQERDAVGDVDRAMGDIRAAAFDDGRPLDDHPPIDASLSRYGRFRRVRELLDAARRDISAYDPDGAAAGDLWRARRDIGLAIAHTDAALRDRMWDHDFWGY